MWLTVMTRMPILNLMVEQISDPLSAVFRALADPTRRAMAETLLNGPRTVGELAAPFEMSLAGAAKHVAALDRAGLVTRRRRGRETLCSLNASALNDARTYLERYAEIWTARLDDLEAALRAELDAETNEGDPT